MVSLLRTCCKMNRSEGGSPIRMAQTIEQKIARLREELNHHNHLYYIEARPQVSDREYDRLMQELIDLEAAHPELRSADSPTQRVGGADVASIHRPTPSYSRPLCLVRVRFAPHARPVPGMRRGGSRGNQPQMNAVERGLKKCIWSYLHSFAFIRCEIE